jgi:hypothetical protein
MGEHENAAKTVTFEQLADLREKTEAIAQFLQTQLQTYLDTLRPLFAPRRFLGKYAGAKEEVVGADKVFSQLQTYYQEVCGKPFALQPELEQDALVQIENRPELYPWEYAHEARNPRETKLLTIHSPARWILSYGSGYTLSQLRQTLAGQLERRPDDIRQFVLHALAMCSLFERYPGMRQLLNDLRYEIRLEKCPGLGDLQFVTISSCLPSFRPTDELILMATRFSGVPAFIELIDTDSVQTLQDPLRARLEQFLC